MPLGLCLVDGGRWRARPVPLVLPRLFFFFDFILFSGNYIKDNVLQCCSLEITAGAGSRHAVLPSHWPGPYPQQQKWWGS
ncbi:hypothetical protein BDV19DRAFT_214039 [Aspergillus venezuelensis]